MDQLHMYYFLSSLCYCKSPLNELLPFIHDHGIFITQHSEGFFDMKEYICHSGSNSACGLLSCSGQNWEVLCWSKWLTWARPAASLLSSPSALFLLHLAGLASFCIYWSQFWFKLMLRHGTKNIITITLEFQMLNRSICKNCCFETWFIY